MEKIERSKFEPSVKMDGKGLVDEIVQEGKEYINTRYELTRLKLIDTTADALSTIITFFLILIVGLFFLFFLSFAVASYLSDIMNSAYAGHFIVAGFYLVVVGLVFIIKNKSIQFPLENFFIRQFLKKQ